MKIKKIVTTKYVSDEGFEFAFPPIEDTLTIEETNSGYIARYLVLDEAPMSPSEFYDEIFLVSGHRDFYIEAPGKKKPETALTDYKQTHWIIPIEAYIHSEVWLALSRMGDLPDRQWDVSQFGAIFASKAKFQTLEAARKAAQGLLETWNMYLNNDVYGCVRETYDKDKKPIGEESCWGFYGYEYAKRELRGF